MRVEDRATIRNEMIINHVEESTVDEDIIDSTVDDDWSSKDKADDQFHDSNGKSRDNNW